MKIGFSRIFSIYTRNLLYAPAKFRATPPNPSVPLLVSWTLRFQSSDSNSSGEAKLPPIQNSNNSMEHDNGVSNQELKRQIEKYYEGDDDAIPSIFEAILKRKLSGSSDEDDKLMEELGLKSPNQDFDDEKEQDFDD